MLFSSQPFVLLLLPITLSLYYLVSASRSLRLAVILVTSVVFYAWWDPRFVPLLLGAILSNWVLAWVYRLYARPWIIVFGVTMNLALLGLFKYANFFAEAVLNAVGVSHQAWDLILPLGISFFTFQQISYLVDLKRGQAPNYPLLEYASFVCFFPQLIAGPIVRHNQLIGQFGDDPLRAGWQERISRGLVLFVLGLIKKVFFADELAPLADHGFAAAAVGAIDAGPAWLSAVAYSLQLYFDFSSYSDMAIGLGGLFGFVLPVNFDNPYRARNIREFWRKWHITLSTFLRDYLYIPLGGSRGAPAATYATIMVTMLLCGLWHGAGWTFVAWGGLHGLAICVNRVWLTTGIRLPDVFSWVLTLLFVVVGWVLFRAEDFSVAAAMLMAMFDMGAEATSRFSGDGLNLVLVGTCFAVIGPTNVRIAASDRILRHSVAFAVAFGLVATVMHVGQGRGLEFIYFQF